MSRSIRRDELLWGLGLLCTAALAAVPAFAADPGAWSASHTVDPVTDAVRDGAVYKAGDDAFLVVCTRHRDGSKRFWVQVQTGEHLGRRGVRELIYRVGDEQPTTSRWSYTPREAVPAWPLEDRHLAERLVDPKAARIVFRLRDDGGEAHDLIVPIGDNARGLIARTLAAC